RPPPAKAKAVDKKVRRRMISIPSHSSRESEQRTTLGTGQLFEGGVTNPVFCPVVIVKVPPFVLIDLEVFRFHCATEMLAVPTLPGGSAGVQWKGAGREFVVARDHGDWL